MSLRATCAGCGKIVKGGDDWAGRSARCPGCSQPIQFPEPIAPPVAAPPIQIPPAAAADPFDGFEEFFASEKAINETTNHAQMNKEIPVLPNFPERSWQPESAARARARSLPTKPLVCCRDCGEPVSRTAKTCPKCGCRHPAAKKWMYALAGVAAIAPLLVLGLWIRNIAQLPAVESPDDVVSLNEFQQIQPGMTYQEVVQIIGETGQLMSQNRFNGMPEVDGQAIRLNSIDTRMYMWTNPWGSNMNAIF